MSLSVTKKSLENATGNPERIKTALYLVALAEAYLIETGEVFFGNEEEINLRLLLQYFEFDVLLDDEGIRLIVTKYKDGETPLFGAFTELLWIDSIEFQELMERLKGFAMLFNVIK